MSEPQPKPLDMPPFQAFLASNIPSVYDNTLSYYDELTKLIAYLEQQVVPAVNANTQGLAQLKSYVENYFKNLDVQEEINNKLDDMAESGELAEIIAAYLELKAVLAYDTPVALKAAENLIEGSYAKTYGYKRKDDGVYDLYTIRAKTEDDVDDGYNTIILTANNNLVAIRLQQGAKRVINVKTSDNLQDYLSLTGPKEIVLPAGVTITETDALLLNSDTTINLNGSTINFSFDRSSIFDYDWDETLGFMGYGPNDEFTVYAGYKNITIKNGSIVGGCSCFMHSQNVSFENVYFQTAGARHSIQLAACKNFTVKNCTFEGGKDASVTAASELINIDSCTYGAQPYLSQYSPIYDGTKNMNVKIAENEFKQTATAGMGYFSAVGSHGNDLTTDIICDGIVISNNNFGYPREYAIGVKNYNNLVVENNTLADENSTYVPHFLRKCGSLTNAVIANNIAKNINNFFTISNPNYTGKNINICENLITAKDANYDQNGVIILINIHDSTISGNTIEYQHHPIHINTRAYYDSVDDNPNEHTINVIVKDNTFEKTIDSAVYFGNRISTCSDVKFVNNNFIHDGSLQSNWVDFLLQNTQTNFRVEGNKTDTPDKFIATSKVTALYASNNSIYKHGSNLYSTSTTGSFDANISYFSSLSLVIGGSSNTQTVELKPYLNNGTKFGTDSRTFIFPISKDNASYGSATFAISNSGADWSYSGDLAIRGIFTKD